MAGGNGSDNKQERIQKQRIMQARTLTIGILIGFVFGYFSTLLVSWSHFIVHDTRNALSTSDQLSQLNCPRITAGATRKSQKVDKGWKNIHVFYGDSEHLIDGSDIPEPYFKANKWFSQFRQDEIVSKLLHGKRGGFFIDLAANDPVRISNTYALETHFDWNGLCMEPNPIYWAGLSYRKCDVVAAIVGGKTMEEVMFRFPRAKAPKGGILGDSFDNKRDQYREGHPRFTVSLLDIFRKFQVPKVIDYISLDIEGAEDLVMTSFPFSKYRFNIMTVERPSDVLSTILNENGYILFTTIKTRTETLWVHSSIIDSLDRSALELDSQTYRYNESKGHERIAPEEGTSTRNNHYSKSS